MLNEIDYTSEFPEITKDTTIEELQAIHKRIWQYVMDHGEKPVTSYIENCAACEWVYVKYGIVSCVHCPIKWPYDAYCGDSISLYHVWDRCRSPMQKGDLTKCIRDVEFKKELERLL